MKQNKSSNFFIDTFFSEVTLFGTMLFYSVVLLIMSRIDFSLFIRSFIILFIVEVVCGAIKLVYPKNRPLPEKEVLQWPLLQKWNSSSFPSIHAARAAALATILVNSYPNDKILLAAAIAVAIAVGYSRVYLRKHDLTDVAAGLVIGALTGGIGMTV